jgi:DNA-directed RNA polymerase specialized sigma24 family protein
MTYLWAEDYDSLGPIRSTSDRVPRGRGGAADCLEPVVSSTEAGSSHTNWALIHDAARGDPLPGGAGPDQAMEQLVRRYWPSVFAYIRKTGRDVHEASDLTQGFVCDVLLGRQLLKSADPERGRFRALLMSTLQNYLHETHRFENRKKRSIVFRPLPLDEKALASADNADSHSPEHAFTSEWGATLVRRVLDRVRNDCVASSLDVHWAVFEARVVRPMLFSDPPLPYPHLIDRFKLKDSGQAANMMVTVKRRFVQALIDEVAATVNDPMQVEEELRDLLREVERP